MPTPEAFMIAYEQALVSQDWAGVAPLIHDDCAVTFSNGTYAGKAAVEQAFRRNFSLIRNERYRMEDIHWVARDDRYAVLIFTFAWTGEIDGRPVSGSGRGTSILVNQSGRWQLLCEHLGPAAA